MAVKIVRGWLVAILAGVVLAGCSSSGDEDGQLAKEAGSPGDEVTVTPDVVYGRKFGMALTLDMYQPRRSNGATVLFMNSGGFVSGQFRQYEVVEGSQYRFLGPDELILVTEQILYDPLKQFSFAELLANGFTVFDVRHGCSPKFTLDEIVEDVRRAVRFVRYNAADFGIDPERIGAWGPSAGGYLALFLGTSSDDGIEDASDPVERVSSRVHSVVAYYAAGFDWVGDAESFPEVIENLPPLQIDREILASLSIERHVSSDDAPALIIYGEDDFPFIKQPCEDMYSSFQQHNVASKRIAIPGTGHEFRGEDGYHAQVGERAMRETVAWFQQYLAP